MLCLTLYWIVQDLSVKKEGPLSTPSSSPRYGTAPLPSDEVMNLSRKSLSHYPYVPPLGFVPMERFLINPEMARNNLISDSVSPASEKQRTWKDELQYAKDTFNGNVSPKQPIALPQAPAKRPYVKQQVPEGEGQHVCDECDKAFNKPSSLSRHKYEHSGEHSNSQLFCHIFLFLDKFTFIHLLNSSFQIIEIKSNKK